MKNDLFNGNWYNFIDEVSLAVRKASKKVGGVHKKCKDCNRKLTDEHSKLVGKGPICRAESSLRFTVIPDVWPSGRSQDRTETLDELEETLEIDFAAIVRCSSAGKSVLEIFRRESKAPYDWVATTDDFPRLALLDEHEYVQHNLIRHIPPLSDGRWAFDSWNACLMIAGLTTGLKMPESDALPRVFETFDEADMPVCAKHLDEWQDDLLHKHERASPASWSECPECNYTEDPAYEIVSLRDLTVQQMVSGDCSADYISNPHYPQAPNKYGAGTGMMNYAATQSNARILCGHFTEIQCAYWALTRWEPGFYSRGAHSSDYDFWIDEAVGQSVWENGHDCMGVAQDGLGWAAGSRWERRIWNYIVASVRLDLKIGDEFGIDDDYPFEILAEYDISFDLHRDKEWSERMNQWFSDLREKNPLLVHIQQIPVIQSIAPMESWPGAWISPLLPAIDINGRIVGSRFTVRDAFDCYDEEHHVDFVKEGFRSETLDAHILRRIKNIQTTTPPTN